MVSGNCAAGFGVCCLFITSTSGAEINNNCTYIQNPNYPSAYGAETAISFKVSKCSASVCTLRLDFESFTTAGPVGTSDVTAAIDTFQITTLPTQYTIPAISGENSGYHVYVEVGKDASATATLDFSFGTSTIARSWEIKVTQLECSNPGRPYDSGCLQYFTGTTGRIESFNFPQTTAANQQHLHSQNYNICIRKESGYSCVQYTPCSDTPTFSVSGTATSKTGSNCSTDWLEIQGGTTCGGSNTLINRYCGSKFSNADGGTVDGSVCDCNSPFSLTFVSNSEAVEAPAATAVQRGFCLEYTLTN